MGRLFEYGAGEGEQPIAGVEALAVTWVFQWSLASFFWREAFILSLSDSPSKRAAFPAQNRLAERLFSAKMTHLPFFAQAMSEPSSSFSAQASPWTLDFSALPGETPSSHQARLFLATQPAWSAQRAALWDAVRRLDSRLFAQARSATQALGLWKAAQADISWVAEAFLDSPGTSDVNAVSSTAANLSQRAEFFQAWGFPWSEISDPTGRLAASRTQAAAQENAERLADLTLATDRSPGDGPHQWALVCIRFCLFGGGVPPAVAQRRGFQVPPQPFAPTQLACAEALLSVRELLSRFDLQRFDSVLVQKTLAADANRSGMIQYGDAQKLLAAAVDLAKKTRHARVERDALAQAAGMGAGSGSDSASESVPAARPIRL